jgi:hypothetical protein
MDMSKALLLDSRTGAFMSDEHKRVAEAVKQYNPDLKVVFVPPEKRQFNDNQPFALVHSPVSQVPYVVRRLSHEDLNMGLIGWIHGNDPDKTDVLAKLDAMHAASVKEKEAKHAAVRAETNEVARAIIGSNLNTYRHKGVTYR